MCAAVDDVHHGDRQGAGRHAADVAVERQPERLGRGARRRHGNAQDRVGAELGLVGGAVELDHAPVERRPGPPHPSRRAAGAMRVTTFPTAVATPLPP